jgi:hypothetical protein
MRLASAVAVLVTGPLVACATTPAAPNRCDPTFLLRTMPAHTPSAKHEIRHGRVLDTAYARRSLGRLIFHVRREWSINPASVVDSYIVALGDSAATELPPLGSVGDSAGIAVVDAVPIAYTLAHVRRIGYRGYTVPLVVRPGYTDSIIVHLASTPVCILESVTVLDHPLQN